MRSRSGPETCSCSARSRPVCPTTVLDTFGPDRRLRLPMLPGNRSLNLSNAVAVTVYEAWRQNGFFGAG